MNIAIVTYALQVGGVETFIKKLASYFLQNDHDVSIIETQSKGIWSQLFSDEGYKVIQILPDPFRSAVHHTRRISRTLSNYDAIFLNNSPNAQASLGFLPEKTVAIPILHMNISSMLRTAAANSENWDAISAVTPYGKDMLIHFGVPGEKAYCIPNGIEIPDEWPKKNHDFSKNKKLRVVFVGRVEHKQKGVLYLPGILEKMMTTTREVSLEIIGDGPDLPRLQDTFNAECQDSDVSFHGYLPNNQVIEILGKSDVLIMPSHYEGLPIVLLEAIALGVVPVVSRLAGRTDFVVEDGKNGFLLEIGDESSFSNCLLKFAENRSLLKSFSFSAWETATQRFSSTRSGSAYLKLAQESIQRRIAGRQPSRSGKIDVNLIGDFPQIPIFLVRPLRKLLRTLGLFPMPEPEPTLYVPCDE